jgi:hypothetical protein
VRLFFTSVIVRGERSSSCPVRFTPWKEPPENNRQEAGVESRDGLGIVEKMLDLTWTRTQALRSSSHSLYRLRYLGSVTVWTEWFRICKMFQKELCNGIPNVPVWRVLRKHLHLKAYKLSIVQHLWIGDWVGPIGPIAGLGTAIAYRYTDSAIPTGLKKIL